MSRFRLPFLTATLLALTACSRPSSSSSSAPPAASASDGQLNPVLESAHYASSLGVDLANSTKLASGLYYRDVLTGSGAVAEPGKIVSVKYAGAFIDGAVFESNVFKFPLGAHAVIDGWDEGIAGMRVGGRRQLIIPPGLAYGSAGSGKIPPNVILVFNVELLAVE